MAQKLAGVPGVYLPTNILQRMEVADRAGNAQEEGIQIALEIIGRIKAYESKASTHPSHACRWDESYKNCERWPGYGPKIFCSIIHLTQFRSKAVL